MVVHEAWARAERVLGVLRARLAPTQLAWLEQALPSGAALSRPALSAAFAGAERRLRVEVSEWSADACAALQAERLVEPAALRPADLARAVLLLRALGCVPDTEHVALVAELLKKGDSAERVAVLRSLAALPAPERFVELAVDSCRSHVQAVFEAVACHNGYPAQHFPEASFNQLVMKALFTGVALEHVHGLPARVNPELVRMAGDFAAERRAAGRAVPEGVATIHAIMEAR